MRIIVSLGVILTLSPAPARAEPASTVTLCDAMAKASARADLPFAFFVRLIWQESRFDPAARSPAGAQGVAQFMPTTAAGRGLLDPFEPTRALDESAAYLKELRATFGNLGLAAAAYNAGPGRVGRWIAGTTSLPRETIDYVQTVTGRSVFEWRMPPVDAAASPTLAPELGFSCLAFAGTAGGLPTRDAGAAGPKAPAPKPWAVILVGSFRKDTALSEYATVRASFAKVLGPHAPSVVRRHLGGAVMMKYVVQIEAQDRAAGDSLCKRLEQAGGTCVVLRNLLR